MPEGDTIHKVAAFIAPKLTGQELVAVQMAGAPQPLLQRRRVQRVEARGKHLLVYLSPDAPEGWIVRAHLGMHGTWHYYPPGAPWQRPHSRAQVALITAAGEQYICFDAEDAEVLQQREADSGTVLARLGPDLLGDTFDVGLLQTRIARAQSHTLLIDLLLNQAIAAGLGNVYKSELLFLHGFHPNTTLAHTNMDEVLAIYRDGRTWLQRNLGGWPRTLTYDRSREPDRPGQSRYYAYLRKDEPCLTCRTPIERAVLGRHNRSCYWCPTCQPAPA